MLDERIKYVSDTKCVGVTSQLGFLRSPAGYLFSQETGKDGQIFPSERKLIQFSEIFRVLPRPSCPRSHPFSAHQQRHMDKLYLFSETSGVTKVSEV